MIWRAKRNSTNNDHEALFKRLEDFFNNDDAQIDGLDQETQIGVRSGSDCDRVAEGHGPFGKCSSNPIPVNGPIGGLGYLSSLRTESGQSLMFHRLGSNKAVDVYEIASLDNVTWDIVYLDVYHPRKSRLAPNGYHLDGDSLRSFRGINKFLMSFPAGIADEVKTLQKELTGFPIKCEIPISANASYFCRPPLQLLKVVEVMSLLDNKFAS